MASSTLLKERFNLPDDTAVVGVEWDFANDCARIYMKGGLMPATPEGCPAIQLHPPRDHGKVEE